MTTCVKEPWSQRLHMRDPSEQVESVCMHVSLLAACTVHLRPSHGSWRDSRIKIRSVSTWLVHGEFSGVVGLGIGVSFARQECQPLLYKCVALSNQKKRP